MDRVLFFLQPQTIRNDGFAFEWVFHKYRAIAEGLRKRGLQCHYLIDDCLKERYGLLEQCLHSPKDFDVRFNSEQWLKGWKEVLLNENVEKKNTLLFLLHKEFPFDVVFSWNYDATLKRFCRERNILTIFQELGLLRSPMLYQMGFDGILWNSSQQQLFRKFEKTGLQDTPDRKSVV